MLTWFQVGRIVEEVQGCSPVKPFCGGIGYDDYTAYANGKDAQRLMDSAESMYYLMMFDIVIGY